MNEKPISVTQLNTYIKNIFDAEELLHGIKIYGEVSGFSVSRDIAYFNLKDDKSILTCVCFDFFKFNGLKNGDQVILTGSPNYYVKGGKLNFNVTKIEPYGQGDLFLQFLKLKETLEKEGLFDPKNKKPIPKKIKKIGVITSQTGAVIQDIITIAHRRNPFVEIVLYPSKVQGNGADLEIISGLKYFDKTDVDVIIVARGGGSMEDLSPFNSEKLAREVFATNKVVVSAVGHETDFTIIDFVSDLRAPTPSAAAELLVYDLSSTLDRILRNKFRLIRSFNTIINQLENRLHIISNKFTYLAQQKIYKATTSLENYKKDLAKAINDLIIQKTYQLSYNENNLKRLNPKHILNIGYAKLEREGIGLSSVNEIDEHEFSVILKDGQFVAKKV